MPKFDKKAARQAARFQREEFGTGALAAQAPQLFEMLMKSPMFAQALRANASAGMGLSANLSRSLGRAGGATSGIGALSSAAGRGAASFGAANLLGNLSSESLNLTNENLMQRMASIAGINQAFQKKTWGEKLLGAIGGGLGALASFGIPGVGGKVAGLASGIVSGQQGDELPPGETNA